MPDFDVVGVGLNATDTVLIVPHFPAYAGKVPFEDEHMSPGGQVASALVACARKLIVFAILFLSASSQGARAQNCTLEKRGSRLTR